MMSEAKSKPINEPSNVPSSEPTKATHRKAIFAASIGNAFEWYDFTIYAAFAIYIAKAFFPSDDSNSELFKAFLAFGIGFLARPLGALVLGVYGDRAGRKAVLTMTIGIMVVGTAILAFAPPYAAIGIGAPLLILTGRALQGFSAGGEVGGAAAFLIEHAPSHRRGEFASWLQASMALSNIMAALIAFAVTSLLSPEHLASWGWRLPFLFGLLIAPIGMWLRRTLEETSEFKDEIARAPSAERTPLKSLVQDGHLPVVLKGVGLSVLWTVSSYVLVIFMPVYVQRTFGYTASQAFGAAIIGNIFLAIFSICGGALSDRIGRRTVLLWAGAALAILPFVMLQWMQSSPTMTHLVISQSLFCIATGLFVGTTPAALTELFPPKVRSIGVSISYNLAVTVFSGFAPAALIWLSTHGGGISAPAWYLLLAAALALPALLMLPGRQSRNFLPQPQSQP